MQQAQGSAQPSVPRFRTNRTHKADGIAQMRRDLPVEVSLVLHDSGQNQRQARGTGNTNGVGGTFVRMDATEEHQVAA